MKGTVKVVSKSHSVPSAKADSKTLKTQVSSALSTANALTKTKVAAGNVSVGASGPRGVESFAMYPATQTVPVGTTIKFSMSAKTFDVHTATFGPGNPETEPTSYLGDLANHFANDPVFPSQAVYPSDPPPAGPAALTPTLHGNGFWNSGLLDVDKATPLPPSNAVTFAAARHVQLLLHGPPVHARARSSSSETRGHGSGPIGCDGGGDFGRRPRCVGGDPRVLGRRRAGAHLEHVAQRARRDPRHAAQPRRRPSSRRSSTAASRRTGAIRCATSPRARATRTSSPDRCCARGPATGCSSTSRTWTRSTSARTPCTSTACTTGRARTAPTSRGSRAATATSSRARRGPTS